MTEAILSKAVSEHFNIVIEGTFRNPATPINTLSLMKENGYKTHVMIQTCTMSLPVLNFLKMPARNFRF